MTPEALRLIQRNITEFGYHTYLISGGPTPRFAYTIGLSDTVGSEIVLAGAALFSAKQVKQIVDTLAALVRRGDTPSDAAVGSLGRFRIAEVCEQWARPMMLGAYGFFGDREPQFWQAVPDENHSTIDVPHMARPWTGDSNGAWRWQFEEWPFSVSRKSTAMTNLAALRGSRVTEVARWEEDQWELFAGPSTEIKDDEARAVALGTLLGADKTLEVAVELPVGGAVWRDEDGGPWHAWARGRA